MTLYTVALPLSIFFVILALWLHSPRFRRILCLRFGPDPTEQFAAAVAKLEVVLGGIHREMDRVNAKRTEIRQKLDTTPELPLGQKLALCTELTQLMDRYMVLAGHSTNITESLLQYRLSVNELRMIHRDWILPRTTDAIVRKAEAAILQAEYRLRNHTTAVEMEQVLRDMRHYANDLAAWLNTGGWGGFDSEGSDHRVCRQNEEAAWEADRHLLAGHSPAFTAEGGIIWQLPKDEAPPPINSVELNARLTRLGDDPHSCKLWDHPSE